MPKTFLSIAEPTVERALDAVANAPRSVDGIEIRFDRLPAAGKAALGAFRERTDRMLLFTRRSSESVKRATEGELIAALEAGFELVDVEFSESFPEALQPHLSRIVLSHHDFITMPEVGGTLARMRTLGCGHVKLAVTPGSFEENLDLLRMIHGIAETNVTLVGMGHPGIYSRMLAPMFGSELLFVARDAGSRTAPGQLTIAEAAILRRSSSRPPGAIFALVGNPATHSISPSIHNPRFVEEKIDAVYVIAETSDFGEVAEAVAAGVRYAPAGIGVTAPFKEEAFRFVLARGGELTLRARSAGAVNTMVRRGDGTLAGDNTDIEGFHAAIEMLGIEPKEAAAVIGSGGTARAALYALQNAGVRCTIYNRTYERALALGSAFGVSAARLDAIETFEGRLLVNTAGSGIELPPGVLRSGRMLINVGYTADQAAIDETARRAGMTVFGGIEFLEAQAPAQFGLFRECAESHLANRRSHRSARN